jgi:surface polysaccharide O-acyltransferase-like enzyme
MRKYWIDYLRVIACIAVINNHVSDGFYYKFGHVSSIDWWIANFISGTSRIGVPLFVMISGCLLLGREQSTKSFFRQRAYRLLPPLIFWSLFFMTLRAYYDEGIISIIKSTLYDGRAYIHLWYLTTFTCLMIFVPFINKLLLGTKPSEIELRFLIAVIFIIFCFEQISSLANEFRHNLRITWFKEFPWYIGYLLFGYYINKYYKDIKVSNHSAVGIILLLTGLGIFLNYISCNDLKVIKDYFVLSNNGPLLFLITASLFYLFRKNAHLFHHSALLMLLSDASFGIYLVHPFFLRLVEDYFPSYYNVGYMSMPLSIAIVCLSSFFVIYTLRKLRIGKLIC